MFLALLAWHSVSFNEKHISREGKGEKGKGADKADKQNKGAGTMQAISMGSSVW